MSKRKRGAHDDDSDYVDVGSHDEDVEDDVVEDEIVSRKWVKRRSKKRVSKRTLNRKKKKKKKRDDDSSYEDTIVKRSKKAQSDSEEKERKHVGRRRKHFIEDVESVEDESEEDVALKNRLRDSEEEDSEEKPNTRSRRQKKGVDDSDEDDVRLTIAKRRKQKKVVDSDEDSEERPNGRKKGSLHLLGGSEEEDSDERPISRKTSRRPLLDEDSDEENNQQQQQRSIPQRRRRKTKRSKLQETLDESEDVDVDSKEKSPNRSTTHMIEKKTEEDEAAKRKREQPAVTENFVSLTLPTPTPFPSPSSSTPKPTTTAAVATATATATAALSVAVSLSVSAADSHSKPAPIEKRDTDISSDDFVINDSTSTEDDQYLPFPPELIDEYEGIEWICSHIFPQKILWSSDPSKIKPNIDSCMIDGGNNNVVNTWFVESPIISFSTSPSPAQVEILFQKAAHFIEQATAVLIVAGAGMGVDSGLPDYRGPQGFWKAYPALKSKGISLESMSHPKWFETDPTAAWGFYGHRAALYHSATPHQGFHILKEMIDGKNYFIFTSNIDSQFQKAGLDESRIYECHGSLEYLQCVNVECDAVWKARKGELPAVTNDLLAQSVPNCYKCGATARPNVSMFEDTNSTWKDTRASAQKSLFLRWLKDVHPAFLKGRKGERREKEWTKKDRVVIIEIGCGVSLHSLRMEVQLLMKEAREASMNTNPIRETAKAINTEEGPPSSILSPLPEDTNVPINSTNHSALPGTTEHDVCCVRINPTHCENENFPDEVDMKMGALEALVNIAKRLKLNSTTPPTHVAADPTRPLPTLSDPSPPTIIVMPNCN